MENNFLKAYQQPEETHTDSLFAEMMLDKSLKDFQREQLLKEIDRSLRNRNKKDFYRLTEKLKKIS